MTTVKERLKENVTGEDLGEKMRGLLGKDTQQVITLGINTHKKLLRVAKDKKHKKSFKEGLKFLEGYKSMVTNGEDITNQSKQVILALVATSLWYWEGE